MSICFDCKYFQEFVPTCKRRKITQPRPISCKLYEPILLTEEDLDEIINDPAVIIATAENILKKGLL